MNDRPGPDATAPSLAVRHGAVTRIPWVDRHLEGIVMAFVELPLAALSFWVAAHVSGLPSRC